MATPATPSKVTAPVPRPSLKPAADLVTALYVEHDAGRSPFFQTEDRARIDRFFERSLAELIWKDAHGPEGEVGAIDFDPLYNAQDVEAKNLKIGAAQQQGDRARVPVTFDNGGTTMQLTVILVPVAGGWKIDDIDYGDATTLRGIFRANDVTTT